MARTTNEPERPRMSIAQAAAWVNPVSGDEAAEVKIRKATLDDAEVIWNFLKELRDEQAKKRPDIVDKEQEILSLEEVQASIEDESKLIFLAENDKEEVLGQILCELEQGEEGTKFIIANIFVKDEARRQRIGTELYHEARQAAQELGCTGAELSCWSFDKEGVSFFERLGYKSLLVTMEKKLGV